MINRNAELSRFGAYEPDLTPENAPSVDLARIVESDKPTRAGRVVEVEHSRPTPSTGWFTTLTVDFGEWGELTARADAFAQAPVCEWCGEPNDLTNPDQAQEGYLVHEFCWKQEIAWEYGRRDPVL